MTQSDVTLTTLKNLAIAQAAGCLWQDAITTNLLILETTPDDNATHNRLGRAYTATGQLELAKQSYQKVLDTDPDNNIAQKNLSKLKLYNKHTNTASNHSLDPSQFLKHSGKTKIVSLTNLASLDILAQINCGDYVEIIARPRTIHITNDNGQKIGRLPDDISYRLIQLINLGYKYAACIKSTNTQKVQIVIQEISRPSNTATHVSFMGK